MIEESEKMVIDTEKKLDKTTGDLKDLIVSFIIQYVAGP